MVFSFETRSTQIFFLNSFLYSRFFHSFCIHDLRCQFTQGRILRNAAFSSMAYPGLDRCSLVLSCGKSSS